MATPILAGVVWAASQGNAGDVPFAARLSCRCRPISYTSVEFPVPPTLSKCCVGQPPSLNQKSNLQTCLMTKGRHPSHTATTRQNRNQVARFRAVCRRKCCTNTLVGKVCGMLGEYSFVKRKGVLQSSQCFFWECDSHSIRQS